MSMDVLNIKYFPGLLTGVINGMLMSLLTVWEILNNKLSVNDVFSVKKNCKPF